MLAQSEKQKEIGRFRRDLTDRQRAMSLFEVLLVLALLTVVVSLSAPLLEGSFSSIRLRRGTDQVLATWSQTRTHAIESGTIFQFRFQPEGSSYRAEPWANGLDVDPVDLITESATNETSTAEIEIANWTYEATLPETIKFGSAESVSKDEFGQKQTTRLDQSNLSAWSVPILFYPDGTTSSASVLLDNGEGLFRRATLRSLTGVGRASDLLTREEVDRLRTR